MLSLTTGLDPASGSTIFGKTLPMSRRIRGCSRRARRSYDAFNVNKLPSTPKRSCRDPTDRATSALVWALHLLFRSSKPSSSGSCRRLPGPHGLRWASTSARAPTSPTDVAGKAWKARAEPDGTRLFALLQSATIQDSNSNNETRLQTRLLVYDLGDHPDGTECEYVLTLPTYRDRQRLVNAMAAERNRGARRQSPRAIARWRPGERQPQPVGSQEHPIVDIRG